MQPWRALTSADQTQAARHRHGHRHGQLFCNLPLPQPTPDGAGGTTAAMASLRALMRMLQSARTPRTSGETCCRCGVP